jgi:hypothetical protein
MGGIGKKIMVGGEAGPRKNARPYLKNKAKNQKGWGCGFSARESA